MLICRFAVGEDIWFGAVDGLDDDDQVTDESIVAPLRATRSWISAPREVS